MVSYILANYRYCATLDPCFAYNFNAGNLRGCLQYLERLLQDLLGELVECLDVPFGYE